MSTPKPNVSLGGLCTFNVAHGFAEALLRGMRSSFLSDPDYHHLTQCETLDDVRLNLTETDYADVLADSNTLTPNSLQKAAVEKVCFYRVVVTAILPAVSAEFGSGCSTYTVYQIHVDEI